MPRKQIVQSDSKIPGVKRVKMRYGPYSVPNMNKTSVTGEAGSLWKYILPSAEKDRRLTNISAIQIPT